MPPTGAVANVLTLHQPGVVSADGEPRPRTAEAISSCSSPSHAPFAAVTTTGRRSSRANAGADTSRRPPLRTCCTSPGLPSRPSRRRPASWSGRVGLKVGHLWVLGPWTPTLVAIDSPVTVTLVEEPSSNVEIFEKSNCEVALALVRSRVIPRLCILVVILGLEVASWFGPRPWRRQRHRRGVCACSPAHEHDKDACTSDTKLSLGHSSLTIYSGPRGPRATAAVESRSARTCRRADVMERVVLDGSSMSSDADQVCIQSHSPHYRKGGRMRRLVAVDFITLDGLCRVSGRRTKTPRVVSSTAAGPPRT